MAFSFRKMLSNINYFKKSEDNPATSPDLNSLASQNLSPENQPVLINFERKETDRSVRHSASLKLPNSVKKFGEKKSSLSDTDLLTVSVDSTVPRSEKRRKCRKLKLDIEKASQPKNHMSDESFNNVENTPRHILLDCKNSDDFSERFKGFDFNKSFDLFEEMSDGQPSSPFEEEVNIDSYSECSESDISIPEDSPIKMCRKVDSRSQDCDDIHIITSPSPVSFTDIELDKNDEERLKTILNYQVKLEEIESLIKKLLNEFHFQIQVSKVLKSKSMSSLSGNEMDLQKIDEIYINHMNEESRAQSTDRSWNVVTNKEEELMKYKLKKQLWSIKSYIEQFLQENLHNFTKYKKCTLQNRSVTTNLRQNKYQKRMSYKKKVKHFDFPDIRDAMLNLFQECQTDCPKPVDLCEFDESDSFKCNCKCHGHSTENDSDSNEKPEQSFSISSSIGNFSLDTSTLTAFSESLDQIVSYNSFQDTSLYNTLLQKAAIERITFYVKVHSIEMTCEHNESDYESKNVIKFNCPPCKYTDSEENGLLHHILSQSHCEKIHFLYKTAYIKKCVASGKEIQPSTVLNPMTMYRDVNKIVCFGDAVYACSLCFENSIIGESILMSHCSDPVHVERREKLADMID